MQSYTCPNCSSKVQQNQICSHINGCQKYQQTILVTIKKLAKQFSLDRAKFLLYELNLAKDELQSIIHKQGQKPIPPPSIIPFNLVDCKSCGRKIYASYELQKIVYVEECWHLFCIPCTKRYIDKEFIKKNGHLTCLTQGCEKAITKQQIKEIIGQKEYQDLLEKSIRILENIVECVKCKYLYGFMPGNPKDAPKRDNNGNLLKQQHSVHFSENKFTCLKPECKTQQCKGCQATPYHLGMKCQQFKQYSLAKKCRYCNQMLEQQKQLKIQYPAHRDICHRPECQQTLKNACNKILPCGHSCSGFLNQAECLPCLNAKCEQSVSKLNGQKGDDYCIICYVECLNSSPCIRSQCGHIFHFKCLQKRLQIKWLTPRILFNFCLCPLCKHWMKFPEQSILSKMINENIALFMTIKSMSLERLKFEGCEKDPKITDKASPYFEKPNQYAMAIYAYFLCFKCKKPYFGGRKNCADAMNEGQNQAAFKPQQLICPNCCQIPVQNCPKHGKDFIQFKCKFCCSIAQWFCWGNTHFCEPCHKRQCNGDYISKYAKDKLPKCQGVGKCPVGGNHNGNGDEISLGCAICRNYKQNNAKF